MREVDPKRFSPRGQEDIRFQGEPIADSPAPEQARPEETAERAEEQADARTGGRPRHSVSRPQERRPIRHPFNIYADQLEALKTIQLALQEQRGYRGVPTLADMARDALDAYITRSVKAQENLEILKDREE